MKIAELDSGDEEWRLRRAVRFLLDESPESSAYVSVTSSQKRTIAVAIVLVVVAILVKPLLASIGLIALATTCYAVVIANRVALFVRSLRAEGVVAVSDWDARAFPEDRLPVYTVLIPAYQEPTVIAKVLGSIDGLEYPRDKLDVKLLLEGDDEETIAAARVAGPGDHVELVLVPPADPRTKPKALNYGLTLARGEVVTIYDAEDRPDPLQLRRAAVAFSQLSDEVVCLQAKLSYHNVSQNVITRWFALEYAMWFSLFLPGLVASGAAIPLGGTSNHFRRHVLDHLGAWDPFNVTEDADLGVRIRRHGLRVVVLDSVTLEEANSDFVNWMKQRSRWYKGYLQTWLVHMRRPRHLAHELGWRDFAEFNVFVGGTPILAVLNPLFWALTLVWFLGHPHFIIAIFPAPVFYTGLVCWAVGNFTVAYLTMITARQMDQPELLVAATLVPIYWLMMSIAAIKGVLQLVLSPSYWEKTTHGLDSVTVSSGEAQSARK